MTLEAIEINVVKGLLFVLPSLATVDHDVEIASEWETAVEAKKILMCFGKI